MPITREEGLAAYREAMKDQGYTKPADFHVAALDSVVTAVAAGLNARSKVSVEKAHLHSQVWSHVETLAEIEENDPDKEIKRWLAVETLKRTWELTKPVGGKLQQMLETRNGNELVVCRYGGLRGERVYVTSDPDCFRVDVIESRSANDVNSLTKVSMFYGRVSKRIPSMAPMIAESFEASLQEMLAAGRAHIPLLHQGAEESE